MNHFFCGLDLGTTNLKVLLCDDAGATAAQASCPTPRIRRDGKVLTDPGAILSAIDALLDEAWSKVGRKGRIAAISSAGVGEDGFLVGPDLAARTSSIPWFDRRAEAEAGELARTCDVRARSGIAFDPTRTAAKWLWSFRHGETPGVDDHWVMLTDWPLVAWSGRLAMSEALAARTGCWDIARHEWIAEALRSAHAPELPPVLPGGTALGCLTADSFPVRLGAADTQTLAVCGGHDHPVAASAIRRQHANAIVDSLGTAELIHAESSERLAAREPLVRTVPVTPGMKSALLHVFEFDRFFADLPDELVRAELKGIPSDAPVAETIRRRLETASMVSAAVVDTMLASGVTDGGLFATGGRARSDVFMQLRADVIGRPIHRVTDEELSCLGAACLAAAAFGRPIEPRIGMSRFDPEPARRARFQAERHARSGMIRELLASQP